MINHSDNSRISIAFTNLESSHWTAGTHYLKNLFFALRTPEFQKRFEIILLSSSSNISVSLQQLVDRILIYPDNFGKAPKFWKRQGQRIGRYAGLSIQTQKNFSDFLKKERVNVLFSGTDYGPKFGVPLLSWIPDFQHLRLPEMFSENEIKTRNNDYLRIATYADRVILSSLNAQRDLSTFASNLLDKSRILSFAVSIPDEVYKTASDWVCDKYHLPKRYIYLPNQFWKHKNHKLVIEALRIAKQNGDELTVVCTGNTNEARHPLHFSELLAKISEYGLRDRFLILGLVPHEHTFALMRQSLAVLQPSLFEGWSTTVEETKSLGKAIILSNLDVHREQNPPQAIFFDPYNPIELYDSMVRIYQERHSGADLSLEAEVKQTTSMRIKKFAETFQEIVLGVSP